MDMEVDVNDAGTNLDQLIDKLLPGEEVVIAKAGKPVARLVRMAPSNGEKPKPILGHARGTVKETPNWWAPLTDKEIEDIFGL